MKFLRVGQRLINLDQVTDIVIGERRVVFCFAFPLVTSDGEGTISSTDAQLEFTGELADKLHAYFAEYWPLGGIGTFDL